MKYFITSDIHSFYNELVVALNEAGFDKNNKEHVFVSLGDLLDRGPDAIKCLKFVNSLERKILIRGNHEDLLEQAICRKEFLQHDLHNGTIDTCYQLINNKELFSVSDIEVLEKVSKNKQLNKYLNNCIDYYEIENNIFVHGWVPCFDEDGYQSDIEKDWRISPNWDRARWLNGMQCWSDGIVISNKTIWCGHWHSSWGHSRLHDDGKEFLSKIETYYINPETGKQEPYVRHDPFIDNGIVAMDACTVISNKVNVKILEV